jgi:FSR family fosmidomycin resistance protein-like MFS transporter
MNSSGSEAATTDPGFPAAEQAVPSAAAVAVPAIVLLSASHFVVDTFAASINPLWRAFELRLGMATGGAIGIFIVWSIATSFGQLAFGLWSDRAPLRWLIWVGPLVAVATISCIGLTETAGALAALLTLGGLGIAAYHPEAATAAGASHPAQRSRMMAIFNVSGFLGQSLGPFYSGWVTSRMGLTGLLWGLVWGGTAVALLVAGLHRSPVPVAVARRSRREEHVDARTWRQMLLLLAIGTLRIVPTGGVPLVLVYLLEARSAPRDVIGGVQSAFMAGIGAGSLACAFVSVRGWERTALCVPIVLAAPLLVLMPAADGWTLVGLVAATGALVGFTMPVFVSYGQELLPHAPRVASSITMGVSWGLAGGIVAATVWWLTRVDRLGDSFAVFAATSLASVVLCWWLPRRTLGA